MSPRGIYICDGTEEEAHEVIQKLLERGTLEKLEKHENWYLLSDFKLTFRNNCAS
jgi:phosphoenolpyruvate carboxykinase (GTP)